MQVFKFGGASIKDAIGIKNLVSVLQTTGFKNTVIVISAMGKTTNALELVLHNYFNNKKELKSNLQDVIKYHNSILFDVFDADSSRDESHQVFKKVNSLFRELDAFLNNNKSPNYDFVYDQVVSFGELISTTIISEYLLSKGIKNQWLDSRELIKTDDSYRQAKVDWKATQTTISKKLDTSVLTITQGFLGSDANNFTTTLGREGSDYTAAIFSYILNATQLTIWKDVPGILNADPRHFKNTQLLTKISYKEAIELAFYGASVIHPKTLQPLQRKEIPLYVKSFLNPKNSGTRVGKGITLNPNIPCYILKKNQVLIELSTLDFSFIIEENISYIFSLLHAYKMKVFAIQNSAISFSVCIENEFDNLEALMQKLKAKFKLNCYKNVSLYTVRHYTTESLKQIEQGKTILLKQFTQETVQIVTK